MDRHVAQAGDDTICVEKAICALRVALGLLDRAGRFHEAALASRALELLGEDVGDVTPAATA